MGVPWTCAKCNHTVPDGRPRCMYCGSSKDGVSAGPAAVPKRSDAGRSASTTETGAWLERHQTTIDIALLVLAAPIAVLSITTSVLVKFVLRLMRRR